MEREAFLDRVRRASVGAVIPAFEAEAPAPVEPEGDLLDRWRERAAGAGVQVHDVVTANDVREAVRGIAEAAGAEAFCAWDDEEMPVHGIGPYLAIAGLTEHVVEGAAVGSLAPVDLGLTSADALLAETGSLVLTTGPGRPRLASVIGSVHVAVVPTDRVLPSLRSWLDPSVGADTANTVVVTGPSRTADIEGVLVRGVHGPGAVHVVLVH